MEITLEFRQHMDKSGFLFYFISCNPFKEKFYQGDTVSSCMSPLQSVYTTAHRLFTYLTPPLVTGGHILLYNADVEVPGADSRRSPPPAARPPAKLIQTLPVQ